MSEPPVSTHPPASDPAPVPTEPVAPADLAPVPSRRERFAWYAGAMLLASALVFVGLRLWSQDLHAPFYYDLDSILYLPLVKTTIDNGTHWRNDRMGEPGVQELYDFPVIDYLHLKILWFFGRFTSDVLLVYNLYNLLTYPLTVLTAMFVLRCLRLSLPAAAVGGLLYAFLPFHQERYHHYFLAAYWVVPLSLQPALAICKGEFPLYPRNPDGTRRRNLLSFGAFWPLALGVMTASGGAYYAFFACASYAFAGVYASVMFRTWRGALSAAWVVAPVVAIGFAYHIPTFAYQWKNGGNPITDRMPEEAEVFGLKLTHLILPANDHNVTVLSRFRAMYSTIHRPVDAESAGSLGVVGATGLVTLLVMAVFPHRRRWPEGPLAGLVLFLILLATVGGFGSIFNVLVTAQIRAYNRISVFIGFFCLFAVMWWADRFLLTRTGRRAKQLRYPAFALLFLLGYCDQTPWGWNWFNPDGMSTIERQAERYRSDKRFFKEIEEKAPGSRVFCLPYVAFPESPPVQKMPNCYEHARGFLMTDTLTWSFGAVKRREADSWQRVVAFEKPEDFLQRIVARGFDGLFIDGRGYPPRPADHGQGEPVSAVNPRASIHALYGKLVKQNAARLPEVIHEDGKQFFLDLRPYRDSLRAVDPVLYEKNATEEREWIAPLWLKGFTVFDTIHDSKPAQWGTHDATLVFVNPTDRTRTIDFSFTIGIEVNGEFHFSFTGLEGLVGGEFDLERYHDEAAPWRTRQSVGRAFHAIKLPPGRSTLRIRCTPPPSFFPADHRKLCYFIEDFRLVEK